MRSGNTGRRERESKGPKSQRTNRGTKGLQRRRAVFEVLEDRRMLFVAFGGGAVWTTTDLTYSYSNMLDGWGSGLTNAQITQAVEEAMGVWASVTPLNFFQTGDSGPLPTSADSLYSAAGNPLIRWGHHFIDGNTGLNTLGHGYRPGTDGRNGDVHFDDANTFTPDGFLELAVHELGHSLGLDHPNGDVADYDGDGNTECPGPFEAIMHACIGGTAPDDWDYTALGTAFLLQDDVDGMRSLYDAGLGYVLNSTGQLSVYGTGQDDIFNLTYDGPSNSITVSRNGYSFTRSLSGVQQIAINGSGGDDFIVVNTLPSHIITVVNGGPGNDTLTIRGGEGGDTIRLLNSTTATNNNSGVLFSDISSVTLAGQGGADVLEVVGVGAGLPVTVNGGDLNDQILLANGGSTGAIQSGVTINGENGADTIYLAPNVPFGISVIDAPVVVNGGAGGDVLNVGSGGLHAVSGLVTYNAGALSEGNSIHLFDGANPFFVDYVVSETSITRSDPFFFGGVNYSGVGAFSLDATQGPNAVTISSSSISSATVNGNGGDDNFIIGNGNNLAGGIGLFTGNGGEGIDTLTLNDSLSTHDLPWAVLGNGTFDPQTIYLGLQAYDLEGYEGATILAGNGNNNFQINGTMAQAVTVNAGGGNDTIELNNVSTFRDFFDQDENPPFNHLVTLDGGEGFNFLVVDDATAIDRSYVISPTHITAYEGAPLGMSFGYDSFQSVTVQAGNFFNDFLVFGTSSDIPAGQQMTILGGPEPESFEVRPHDDEGNLTINGNLGIGGGGGIDSLLVNDTFSSLPIDYTFYNQFGPSTTNIGGLGAAGFGAGSNIENITVSAGGGDDTFSINSFQSGSGLAINGGGGNDWLRFGQSNLIAEVTSMSSFNFNGQDGTDTFDLNNFNDTVGYTYSRVNGTTTAARSLGGFYQLNDSNIELLQIWAGSAVDGLYLDAVESGLLMVFVSGAGTDGLAIGFIGNSLDNIRGPVVYYAGADGGQLSVWDGLDSTGDTVHLTANTLGAGLSDDLFGPGGTLTYYDVSSIFSVNLGSGEDTVYAEPLAAVPLTINAAGPSSAPGDTLRLSYAHAMNPAFTPGGVGAGTYTFSDAAAVNYTGFETVSAYRPGDYDGDGAVTEADYDVWRANFGQSVAPGTDGDGNGDGIVDLADYTVWRDYLGTVGGGGAGAIAMRSEPKSATLVASELVASIETTGSRDILQRRNFTRAILRDEAVVDDALAAWVSRRMNRSRFERGESQPESTARAALELLDEASSAGREAVFKHWERGVGARFLSRSV